MSPPLAGRARFPASSAGSVPGFLVQSLLQVLRSEGVMAKELRGAPALAEPAEFTVSEAQFRDLLRALSAHDRERALGLLIGERLTEANLHGPGALVAVSRTMQDAYENVLSLNERAELAPAGVLEIDGETASWVLQPTHLGALWEDLLIANCFHTARRFLSATQSFRNGAACALHVHFARPRPANAADYERCFEGQVSFDATATKLSFPRRLLDLPRPGVDDMLASDMRLLLLRRVEPAPARWSERVEAALREYAGLAEVDFERLAARWNVSMRTLRRRVALEGQTLSELLDKVRFERARYFLEHTSAPHAEIAEALGYADETSFRRAFKRWSGESPRHHRALRAGEGGRSR